MTNSDAIKAILGQINVPDNSLQFELQNAGLDGTADYDPANEAQLGSIACELLAGILIAPSVSEGGYSIKYDLTGVKSLLAYLAAKYGRNDLIEKLTPSVNSFIPW